MSSEGDTLKLTTKVDVEPSTSSIGAATKQLNDVPTTSGTVTGLGVGVDDVQRRREAQLRQHSFFQLRIHLLSGHRWIKAVMLLRSISRASFPASYPSINLGSEGFNPFLFFFLQQEPVIRTLNLRWEADCCTNQKPCTRI